MAEERRANGQWLMLECNGKHPAWDWQLLEWDGEHPPISGQIVEWNGEQLGLEKLSAISGQHSVTAED